MTNISSVSYQEKITIDKDQAQGTTPQIEDEGFASMLAMWLGLTIPPGNELMQTVLPAEMGGDGLCQQSNLVNNPVSGFMTMLNPELQANQQSMEDAKLLNNQMTNVAALDNPDVSTKAENFLQQISMTDDESAHLQQKTAGNGSDAEHLVEQISEEKLAAFSSTSLDKENLHKEGNTADLKNVKEQVKSTGKGEDTNTIEQNNEVLTQEEVLVKAFTTNDKGNTGGLAKDSTVKAEQLPQELPELVMSKLKTFEHKDGSKDIVIHLEPKELGKLVVKLTTQEGVVSVKFMAHYPVTRDLLESSLNNLRQSFNEQGISFDRMDVELGGQQLDQSQYQQRQYEGGQGENHTAMSSGSDAEGYYDNFVSEDEQDRVLNTGTYDYLV